ITINGDDKDIQLNLAGTNNMYQSISIPIVNLNNTIESGLITSTFLASDKDQLPRLEFGAALHKTDSSFYLTLEDSLILNQKNWTISKGNKISFEEEGVYIEDFALT